MKRKWIAMLCVFIIPMLLSACGGKTNNTAPAPAPAPSPATPGEGTQPTANAESIFKQNCVACHGDNLEGKMGGNTNLQKVGSKLSRDQIIHQIESGGNGMPGFRGNLSDQQISALADWLAAKK